MSPSRLRTVLLAASVLGVFMAFTAWPVVWRYVGVLEIGRPYADVIAILSAGQAHQAGYDVHVENPFDPFSRTHVYGPLWLHTGALGLRVEDAAWLGPLMVAAFVVVAAVVLAPGSTSAMVGAALVLLSPPVLLGMERANNDLLIFLLLAAAAWLAVRDRRASLAASGIMALAGLLKFYPIATVVALVGSKGRLRWRLALATGAVAVFVGGWLAQASEYESALLIAPRPLSIFAYGIGLLPLSWNRLEDTQLWLCLGFVPVALLGGWAVWRLRDRWWNLLAIGEWRSVFAAMTGLAWICCFALTLSFPYRAVFLVPWFAFWWRPAPEARVLRAFAAGLVAVLWLGSPKLYIVARLEEIPGSTRIVSVFSGIEQAALIAVTITLALAVGGWLVREWRRATGVAPADA